MNKKVILTLGIILIIVAASIGAIFYARGFKFNTRDGLSRTGLLVVKSTPEGASIFLDDRLTDATNTTITYLKPKKYKVKLTKEGYTPWEKEIEIRPDLTEEIEAVLFPSTPELKPITFTGATNPILSPSGTKIVFGITEGKKAGLWVLDMTDRTFVFSRDPRQIVKDTPEFAFSKTTPNWSPDSKTIWVKIQEGAKSGEEFTRNFLLDEGRLNENLTDSTATLESILSLWQQEINLQEEAKLKRIPKTLAQLATDSAKILSSNAATVSAARQLLNYNPANLIWSPDETKFFINKGKSKSDFSKGATLYRIKDKNPLKKVPATFEIPAADNIFWYPDSEHLVLVEKDKISIIEFEGTNKATVYSGTFENSYVFSWPDGSRLVILTSFNQAAQTPPNLYTINLR